MKRSFYPPPPQYFVSFLLFRMMLLPIFLLLQQNSVFIRLFYRHFLMNFCDYYPPVPQGLRVKLKGRFWGVQSGPYYQRGGGGIDFAISNQVGWRFWGIITEQPGAAKPEELGILKIGYGFFYLQL